MFLHTNSFIKKAVYTEALIVGLEPNAMYEGEQLYAPVIQFKDSKGNLIKKE